MPNRARKLLRSFVGWVFDRIPAGWFVRLREAYAARRSSPLLRRAAGVARYRTLPLQEFEDLDYPGVRFAAADSHVLGRVFWLGGDAYEGAETHWWRRSCARATHVLELGANVGYYSVHGGAANRSCRYVAAEPHPSSAAALRTNLALNGLDHVEVLEAAVVGVADAPTMTLAVPEQDRYAAPAGAFIPDGAEGTEGIVVGASVEVAVVPVADLFDGVDLLKLDIEGHEADVLEIILDRILEQKPTIFLEVRLKSSPRLRSIISELAKGGYVVFAIGTETLHLLPQDVLDQPDRLPRFGTRDLMLVPAGLVADL